MVTQSNAGCSVEIEGVDGPGESLAGKERCHSLVSEGEEECRGAGFFARLEGPQGSKCLGGAGRRPGWLEREGNHVKTGKWCRRTRWVLSWRWHDSCLLKGALEDDLLGTRRGVEKERGGL